MDVGALQATHCRQQTFIRVAEADGRTNILSILSNRVNQVKHRFKRFNNASTKCALHTENEERGENREPNSLEL